MSHKKDYMNFTSPMSLEEFGLSNGITDVSKSIFPYELWSDITQIAQCTTFPAFKCFESSLGKNGGEKWLSELVDVANDLSKDCLNDSEKWHVVLHFFGSDISELKNILELENNQFQLVKSEEMIKLPTSPVKYRASKQYFAQHCLTMLDYLRKCSKITGLIDIMQFESREMLNKVTRISRRLTRKFQIVFLLFRQFFIKGEKWLLIFYCIFWLKFGKP